MDNHLNIIAGTKKQRHIHRVIGYVIAIACLVWIFHDLHFNQVLKTMKDINWWLIPLAVVFDILSYASQGMRWKLLLHPQGSISVIKTTQAIYAGLFTNEILPLRVGEVVRMYLVSRWMSVKFILVVPSLVMERFFDGIWLALAIGLAAIFFPLPEKLLEAEEALGVIIIVLTIIIVYVIFRKGEKISTEDISQPAVRWKPIRLISATIARLAIGIKDIGLSKHFYLSFFVSSGIWIFQLISYWLVMRAYGIHLSIFAGTVVFLILHLGTAIPNAPSNVGTYQFFTIVGLSLFNVDKTVATGFSLVVFFILTVPLWIIGLYAIGKTGMTFSSIRNEIKHIQIKL